jgi:hypothetical protein
MAVLGLLNIRTLRQADKQKKQNKILKKAIQTHDQKGRNKQELLQNPP